ncbi:HD domain-containing phosphohydrolase [Clostridium sp. DL1XJH146]
MKKNGDRVIKENQSFYKKLFRDNQEIMLLINPETFDIVDCNLSACNFYGYSYDEMLELSIKDLNILSKEQIAREINSAKTEYKNTFYFKHRIYNGEIRDIKVNSTPINIDSESLLFSIITDITASKIQSDKLKIENTNLENIIAHRTYELEKTNLVLDKANNLFSAILESSPEIVVFALDCNYRYLAFNNKHRDAIRTIWGKEIEIGMNMLDIIGEHGDNKKAKANFDRALAGESFVEVEEFGNEKLSRLYWQDYWAPIFSKEGKVTGLTCFVMNVTDRKLAEKKIKENERILRESQKVVRIGSYINDVVNRTWSSSEETNRIFGIDDNYERTQRGWLNIVHPDYRREFFQCVSKFYSEKTRLDYKCKIIRFNDGEQRWVHILGELEYDEEGNVVSMLGTIEDITERRAQIIARTEEKKLLETTLRSIGDGVISTDNNGNVVLINKAAEFLTGWTQEESIGKPIEEIFNIINEITREKSKGIVRKVLESGKALKLVNNAILISKEGIERHIENNAAPIINENYSISGIVLVFRDITERKEKQREISKLSYNDHLTGLYNRRYYNEALKIIDIEENLPLTVVMGDVNGLKLINDSFGHDIGDDLIKKVAKCMRNGCRTSDIIARIGGDEFVILLPKTTEVEAEKIIKRINNFTAKEKVESLNISISFGYETKKDPLQKIENIFKNAEDNMYKEKLFESPSMRGRTINAILRTLHEKNKREEQHSNRVSMLCERMGHALGLSEYGINELKTVGLLHDIGKIAIDENILNKPDKLTSNEWHEIQRHPEIGYRILSTVNDMSDIANYTLYHHERWDGKGYPKGLKGEEIPFISRIISIADTFDAMTSDRSYRNALQTDAAIAELQKNSGTQFDPELVDMFIKRVTSGEMGYIK